MNLPVVVISDQHIASGPLDDCDAQLESHLVAFVDSLFPRLGALELVLNGDVLDFVQAEPWSGAELESTSPNGIPLCFTEAQSIQKLESIRKAHPGVFDALGRFLERSADNRLTILPGNHDADFHWAGVRQRFETFVGPTQFVLDPVYRPVSCPSVWIEHGHQSDPVNCFEWKEAPYWSKESPPIFIDPTGTPRLYECPGTRFLLKFMNRLDNEYPFVDNVKPFSRFVKIFGSSAFAPGYGSLKVALTVGRMLAYINTLVHHHRKDVLSHGTASEPGVADYLRKRFSTTSKLELESIARKLRDHGVILEQSLAMSMAVPAEAERLLAVFDEHPELLAGLEAAGAATLGGAIPGTLTMAAGFVADETKALTEAADRALATPGVNLVLMGHTHEAVARSTRSYINTGSWTRYYRYQDGQATASWDVLRTDSYTTFPYQLNYVEILNGRAADARLATYHERHA